jgi:N-acetylglutamate synthase-like GNAT family acetyltransferase
MFTIHPADAADLPAIRKIIFQVRINPTGLNWRRFLVAVDPSGKIVGCGQIKPHHDGSHELASIAVVPEWRGQGVARKIITILLTQHPQELYLTCRSSLGAFYERFGFQEVKPEDMPPYFRQIDRLARWVKRLEKRGETLLVMRKTPD